MGPVAWFEAAKVEGLNIIDKEMGIVSIENSNSIVTINNLVNRFIKLFGRAGREVCKEAAGTLIADLKPNQVPTSLE